MSYDNQGYSSGNQSGWSPSESAFGSPNITGDYGSGSQHSADNQGSAGHQGSADHAYADSPQHGSSQQPYDDYQADPDSETTQHRASMFGDAQRVYPTSGSAGYPTSGSAGYPTSGSAGYPTSGSAGYPTQQQVAAGYPTPHGATAYAGQPHNPADPDNQAGWGTPHQQAPDQTWGAPQHHAPGQAWSTTQHQTTQPAWGPPAQQTPRDDNVVSALTDFSFTKMATPGLVKVFYIAAAVLGILQVLGFTFTAFTLGGQIGTIGVAFGIMSLIGGLIGLLVFVLAVRIYLELALSVVRTAQDVRHIRGKFDQPD